MAKIKLSKKKISEIEVFLKNRFYELDDIRQEFDDDIEEEVELYNDFDKYIDQKDDWEEKIKVPYIYTIVQTMVARLIETLFGEDNYLKVFVEDKTFVDVQISLQHWLQNMLDKMKLKSRSRDFIEEALVQRTVWLQIRPILKNRTFKGVDFDVIKWFDIWFDTTAVHVEDTDIFVRKIVKLFKIMSNKSVYFNTDKVLNTIPPEDIRKQEEYKAKHGVSKYYDETTLDPTERVEILEWYGTYNFGDVKNPDMKDVIFTIANREILIRAETPELNTERKKLFFPIRPLRQANSLIGKSVPQLTKDMQYELNEIRSLRMQNFKTQIKLLFKMKREAGIDLGELFAKGGNVIGYEDDKNDIDAFPVPNLVQLASFMSAELLQDMQQVTGAVDYLMGTSAARGVTETATGIQEITEQALFKFGMMANNVYDDLLDFINYVMIMYIKFGKREILLKRPELNEFFNQTEEELENSYAIDLALHDLAARRDVERSQFINAINIIAGLMAQTGGNMKELLKQVMEKLKMENIDKILEAPPAPPEQMLAQQNQERGGSNKISPQADNAATPEEEALGVQPTL